MCYGSRRVWLHHWGTSIDKGVREFVEAARLLRTDMPSARFQLLGPMDEGNRSAIAQSELDQWVKGSAPINRLFTLHGDAVPLTTRTRLQAFPGA